jgi:hypothetical protein
VSERDEGHQREHVRVDAAQPVVVAPGHGGRKLKTHTSNISGRAMLIDAASLEVGARVNFTLDIGPGKTPIHRTAVVIRQDEADDRVALKFEEIDPVSSGG